MSVEGTLKSKTPPQEQVAFSISVPGTGPIRLAHKKRLLAQGLGLDAKKGRKHRGLFCARNREPEEVVQRLANLKKELLVVREIKFSDL